MTSRSDNPVFAIDTAAIDTFLNISKAYLAGAERLIALNLGTARQALDDTAQAGATLLAVSQGEQATGTLAALGPQQLMEKTLAYARTSSEILARTQDEITELWSRHLAERPPLFATPPGWLTPPALFTPLFTQMLEQMGSLAANRPAATAHAKGHAAQTAVAAATRKAA